MFKKNKDNTLQKQAQIIKEKNKKIRKLEKALKLVNLETENKKLSAVIEAFNSTFENVKATVDMDLNKNMLDFAENQDLLIELVRKIIDNLKDEEDESPTELASEGV